MDIESLIFKGNSKSCGLDLIPATIVKETLHSLIPVLTKIVNKS